MILTKTKPVLCFPIRLAYGTKTSFQNYYTALKQIALESHEMGTALINLVLWELLTHFKSPKCKIKVTKRNHENPINFSTREYSKSVYMTGANNDLKNYYHYGRRYSEHLEYPSRTLSLTSANELIKYIILSTEISVGLMLSPLFIFILRRLRKFKTFRMDSVSCSSASNFATLSRRQT